MRPNLDRQSAEAFIQPRAELRLLSRRHTGLTALPVAGRKRVPAALSVGLVPAADGIIVQIQKLRDSLTGLPVIKEQDCIGAPCNAVIFALRAHANLKFASL